MTTSSIEAIVFAPADGATGEELRGSGRSITGFHLRDALDTLKRRSNGEYLKYEDKLELSINDNLILYILQKV